MQIPTPSTNTNTNPNLPSLPQAVSAADREQREFQLSLARTTYNYMRSYLEPIPMSADLPKGEEFSVAYEAKVLQAFVPIAENFKKVVMGLLTKELDGDLPTQALAQIQQAHDKFAKEESVWHPEKDLANLKGFIDSLAQLPKALEGLVRIPKDLEKMATGLGKAFDDFIKEGPTGFLKSTLFDMLSSDHGRDYLQATHLDDYKALFLDLPLPLTLTLPRQPWMPAGTQPWEQDWYFGNLQTAGYNTTNLKGVVLEQGPGGQAIRLTDLLKKFPITDAIFQGVVGDACLSLEHATRQNRLYVCDYSMLEGCTSDVFHREQRYLAAPIALFYWNPTPPKGYPPCAEGVLQPIAIQLAQAHDAETAPLFTPPYSRPTTAPTRATPTVLSGRLPSILSTWCAPFSMSR